MTLFRLFCLLRTTCEDGITALPKSVTALSLLLILGAVGCVPDDPEPVWVPAPCDEQEYPPGPYGTSACGVIENACFPPANDLADLLSGCERCDEDAQCGGSNDHCLSQDPFSGAGRYCSQTCDPASTDSTCPADATCEETMWCAADETWVHDCEWCSDPAACGSAEGEPVYQCVRAAGACSLSLSDIYADESVLGVLLFGTAGWCQFCTQEAVWLNEIYAGLQNVDGAGGRIEIIAVVFEDDFGITATQDYAERYALYKGLLFPAVADTSGAILNYFDASAAPGNIFISRNGMIMTEVLQGFDQSALEREIEALDGSPACQ